MILNQIKLDGLSGATISLQNNEIIKQCAPSYSLRLLKQAELQNNFASLLETIPGVNAVKIKRIPNNTTIIMDLIRTPNLHSIIELLQPDDIRRIAHLLRELIKFEKNRTVPDSYYTVKLPNKIKEVQDSSVRFKLNNLLLSANPIQTTISHGDLTLGNILYHNNQLHLIDFLDGFISSYILDICKLRQDLLYHYSDSILSYRRRLYYEYILEEVMKECDIDKNTLRLFDTLNFARILPYAKDKTKILEIIQYI